MSRQAAVPYCTVKGFRRALGVLADPALPEPVDRVVLVERGISPHAVYPVLGALRYLGVLDERGRVVRPALEAFRGEDLAARRVLVESAFAPVLADVSLPVEDREVLDQILVERHDCAPGVAPFCSTFLLWLLAESGLPVMSPVAHRRGRPPAHLAELSDAARLHLEQEAARERRQRPRLDDVVARAPGSSGDDGDRPLRRRVSGHAPT